MCELEWGAHFQQHDCRAFKCSVFWHLSWGQAEQTAQIRPLRASGLPKRGGLPALPPERAQSCSRTLSSLASSADLDALAPAAYQAMGEGTDAHKLCTTNLLEPLLSLTDTLRCLRPLTLGLPASCHASSAFPSRIKRAFISRFANCPGAVSGMGWFPWAASSALPGSFAAIALLLFCFWTQSQGSCSNQGCRDAAILNTALPASSDSTPPLLPGCSFT